MNLRTIPNDRQCCLSITRFLFLFVLCWSEGNYQKFDRPWTILLSCPLVWILWMEFLLKTIQVFHWRFTVAGRPRVPARGAAQEDRWPTHSRGGLAAVVAAVPWYHRREQVRHVPPPSCLYRVTCRRPKAGTSIDVPLAMLLRDRPTASVDDQRSF